MIDVYENPTLDARYRATRRRFAAAKKPAQEVVVFHGTSSSNVSKIMLDGFRVGGSDGVPVANGSAYGVGVYTAVGPNTPMNYSRGSPQVILSYALTGEVGSAQSGDSWRPNGDWHIFRHGNQLKPKWVVHYQ